MTILLTARQSIYVIEVYLYQVTDCKCTFLHT